MEGHLWWRLPRWDSDKEAFCKYRRYKRCRFDVGWEDPLEEGMVSHSSILAMENSMDRGAWQATVHGGHKKSDMTEWLTLFPWLDLEATVSLPFLPPLGKLIRCSRSGKELSENVCVTFPASSLTLQQLRSSPSAQLLLRSYSTPPK